MLTKDDFENMAKILDRAEWIVPVHPLIWNGYWAVEREIPFLRKLGRFLHSKHIYWLGFQVRWTPGLKEFYRDHQEES